MTLAFGPSINILYYLQMSAEHRISVKALLRNGDDILLLREASGDNSGKYHFPGGHLEPGESMYDGLHREIGQETGIRQLAIGEPYYSCEWAAIIGGQAMRVVGIFFPCRTEEREIKLSPEHDHSIWIPPLHYIHHPMVTFADRIIERYVELDRAGQLVF